MYSAFSKNNSKVFVNRNKPERAQRTCQTRTVSSFFHHLRAGMVRDSSAEGTGRKGAVT